MKNIDLAVIPGDGIGKEVVDEGIKILNCLSDATKSFDINYTYYPWGCEYYLEKGEMMPHDGIDQLSQHDAIFLGAVGFPGVPDHISLWDLLLNIRQSFDQYVNLRPIKLLRGAPSPIKTASPESVDMLFVRENVEGEYSGVGSHLYPNTQREVVIQESVFSRVGTERIIRYAFEMARSRRKNLSSITKSNALNYSMVFWDEIFEEVSKEYPDVTTHKYHVDAASMLMVTNPEKFDVIVGSNLFGDILTDLGAAIAGGIGLAAGANINPERKYPSMFEPIHGSAPDIAGKGLANPLASIWSVAQMVEFFGFEELSDIIITAIERLLVSGQCLTPDMGGTATTEEVGNAVKQLILEQID